jgi:hypothetical protein
MISLRTIRVILRDIRGMVKGETDSYARGFREVLLRVEYRLKSEEIDE